MDKSMEVSQILPGRLYLGNRDGAKSRDLLRRLRVTHVVNAAAEQPNFFPGEFQYYNSHLQDSATERVDFDGPSWFIQGALAQGGVVFVHCMAGVSRAASLVAGYLMKTHGMSMRDALEHIRARRPFIDPNPGYMQQLSEMDRRAGGTGFAPADFGSSYSGYPSPGYGGVQGWGGVKPSSELNHCIIS